MLAFIINNHNTDGTKQAKWGKYYAHCINFIAKLLILIFLKEIEKLEKQQKDVKDNDSAKRISLQLALVQIKWKLADSKRVRKCSSYR